MNLELLVVRVAKDLAPRDKFSPELRTNFERVTGIYKTRRWNGSATALAIQSAKIAATANNGGPILGVIVVTQSPDRKSPCMAIEIAGALGLGKDTIAFDVNQSCDGFVYGLWLANLMKARVLLVVVDMLRAREDAIDSLIFSDASAAAIIGPDDGASIMTAGFYTDPSGSEKLCADSKGLLKMDGGAVYDFATEKVPELISSYTAKNGGFDYLCQHQPNESMMKVIEKRSGFTGRSLRAINEYGNASLVSLPIALAANEDKIKGKRVLLAGYGAGWAAALMGLGWSGNRITHLSEVE